MNSLHTLSAKQLRDQFLTGSIKATEIAQTFLKRIDESNEKLGAFLSIFHDKAVQKAKELDEKREKGLPLGKLAGVPIAIKDNMHIQGEITTCASKFLSNYKAPFDSTVVKLLQAEDAIFVGKTNLDEFAMGSSNEKSAYYPCQNPWDLNCVPGGSSGGSAASVAARLSLLSTGSDTGGSIRLPASFCGIVGFKPTYGRVSRYGLVAFGSSLDQIGPFATNVEDAALMMEVIGKYCPNDSMSINLPQEQFKALSHLKEKVIGVPYSLLEGLDSSMLNHFENNLTILKELGAKIVPVDLSILKSSVAVYYILATAEASTNLARFDGIRYGIQSKDASSLDEVFEKSRKESFGKEVKRRILLGTFVLSSGFQDAYYKKAQKVRTLILESFKNTFEACDMIATPVSPSGAFEKNSLQDPLKMYLQDIFTIPANLAGLPSISVPSGFDSRGMPLGLLLTGPQLCDIDVLQMASAFESLASIETLPKEFK
jgi:aspartyl-tRNA(Asn)/glutamyl-tRNA(Gln) amidotransferase subunit A